MVQGISISISVHTYISKTENKLELSEFGMRCQYSLNIKELPYFSSSFCILFKKKNQTGGGLSGGNLLISAFGRERQAESVSLWTVCTTWRVSSIQGYTVRHGVKGRHKRAD